MRFRYDGRTALLLAAPSASSAQPAAGHLRGAAEGALIGATLGATAWGAPTASGFAVRVGVR